MGMHGRANRRRGEVEAEMDGERRILCLTLGALAELWLGDLLTADVEQSAGRAGGGHEPDLAPDVLAGREDLPHHRAHGAGGTDQSERGLTHTRCCGHRPVPA